MAELSTIGSMVLGVFGMASETQLRDVANEAAQDAYKALKQRLYCLAAFDVYVLERNPGSVGRRAVIAEVVDRLPEDEKISVKTLATELAEALGTSASHSPTGIDVRRVEAARTKLEGIDAHESSTHEILVRESHYLD